MESNTTGVGVAHEVEAVPLTSTAATRPIAADRTRWGPIWAGLVTTFSIFLVLEALLFWAGGLALKSGVSGIVVNHPWITWVIAMIAFFIGGLNTASTSAVRGPSAGAMNGFIVWALATTLFAAVSFLGAGAAAGTIGGLVGRFVSLGALKNATNLTPAMLSDLRTAAGWALLTLVTTAIAAALGGLLGSTGRPMGYVAREKRPL